MQAESQLQILSTTNRVPPQAVDVERAVIGAMCMAGENGETVDMVQSILPVEAFYHTPHRKIYSAILSIHERKEPIDQLLLTQELDKQGQLDEAGGAWYIAELAGDMATTSNVEYHAQIVFEKYRRRCLIDRANQLATRCYDESEDTEDLVQGSVRLSDGLDGLRDDGLVTMGDAAREAYEEIQYRSENPTELIGVPTGILALDDLTLGLQPTDLVILAARPSMGKTALSLVFARNAAKETPVLYFSREMSIQQLAQRSFALESRINSYALRKGTLMQDDWETLDRAYNSLWNCPVYLDEKSQDVSAMAARARKAQKDYGIGLVVVDYLQITDPPRGKRYQSKEQEVAAISKALKDMAKELGVPVVALSQLSRALESRNDKRPQLSDLRDSGAIEQDADMVMFLYRPTVYGIDFYNGENGADDLDVRQLAEIIIAKNRMGPIGTINSYFDIKTGFFGDWTDG